MKVEMSIDSILERQDVSEEVKERISKNLFEHKMA